MNSISILSGIADIKIQGAENIAKTAISLIRDKVFKLKYDELLALKQKLISLRPTEPCLRNSLKYIFSGDLEPKAIKTRCDIVLTHFTISMSKIAEIGSKKISNDMLVYTHCHSSTVINILKKARKDGKRFRVNCTETRPLFQGRLTAKELVNACVPTTLFIDSAIRLALKKADICLIGADSITTEGYVINKIGSEAIAATCKEFGIPVYSCTNSWKFDSESIYGHEEAIEQRPLKEIWDHAPKGLNISNAAFEKIAPELITGLITEVGIFKPSVFVEELKNTATWMFKNN
jgi:ribose 1,5-bisphosphate isomerase